MDNPRVKHLKRVVDPRVPSGTTPCFKAPQVGWTSRADESGGEIAGGREGGGAGGVWPIRGRKMIMGPEGQLGALQ